MPVTINGTTGIAGPDGSASTPAVQGTDSNTGLFYPAADTVALSTGGSERLRIDSSGNLGIGVTPSAWGSSWRALQVASVGSLWGNASSSSGLYVGSNYYFDGTNRRYITTNPAIELSLGSGGTFALLQAPSGTAGNVASFTQAMTLNASGNLGIGTSSPSSRLHVSYATGTTAGAKGVQLVGQPDIGSAGGTQYGLYVVGLGARYSSQTGIYAVTGEAAPGTIGTYGNEYYSVYGASSVSTQSSQECSAIYGTADATAFNYNRIYGVRGVATPGSVSFLNENPLSSVHGGFGGHFVAHGKASNCGVYADAYLDASPGAGTVARPLICATNGSFIMYVMTNGGIANYSSNNTNLSDQREKKNINLAGNYLDKLCAIPVKTFQFINEGDDADITLGVIAQDVQAIAPEFVTEDAWPTEEEPDRKRLSLYQTDMQFALMRAVQELKAIVDAQAARISALEAA